MPSEESAAPANFEEAFGRLRKSIEELEGGPLPLDVAMARYEEGIRLANICNDFLDNAEVRIKDVLRETNRGESSL